MSLCKGRLSWQRNEQCWGDAMQLSNNVYTAPLSAGDDTIVSGHSRSKTTMLLMGSSNARFVSLDRYPATSLADVEVRKDL